MLHQLCGTYLRSPTSNNTLDIEFEVSVDSLHSSLGAIRKITAFSGAAHRGRPAICEVACGPDQTKGFSNPPQVDRIWLWVYYSKIPIYPVFYLLKVDTPFDNGAETVVT